MVISLLGTEKKFYFRGDQVLWIEYEENGLLEVGGMAASTSVKLDKYEANLVISVVFLVAWGLWGGPLGWRMGDAPPQEAEGAGGIRTT